MVNQISQPENKPNSELGQLSAQSKSQGTELERLRMVRDATLRLGTTLDLDELVSKLAALVREYIECQRVLVFTVDTPGSALRFGASSRVMENMEIKEKLESVVISTQKIAGDTRLGVLMTGSPVDVAGDLEPDSVFSEAAEQLRIEDFLLWPLMLNDRMVCILCLDTTDDVPLPDDAQLLLEDLGSGMAIAVENARQHSETVAKLASNMQEMNVLHQIDDELNATMALQHVFNMVLDWALRFTNAHVASLALYDEASDTLEASVDYGYSVDAEKLAVMRAEFGDGIAHRVARSAHYEIIPDVSYDKDYMPLEPSIRAIMAVPILREDKVVAVMTLGTRTLNGFSEDHIRFMEKLATRAGVAVHNARLFTETTREREKLSAIVSNTADIIIVVGKDNNIELANDSAIAALRTYGESRSFAGQPFTELIGDNALRQFFARASAANERQFDEIALPNNKAYHATITPNEDIGWILVMQDITPFKEMDALKNELLATVSHDLKQPLSVMRGYLDLLQMSNRFDEKSSTYMEMLDRAIRSMRQLIDDLLDIARIESGEKLEMRPVNLKHLIRSCIDSEMPNVQAKNMTVTSDIPDNLPAVNGERARLAQIFTNLISNAVKYTQPEGKIEITADIREQAIRIGIKDNGLGISPEDQAHIFDRFYRVRRPETDSIEGTGLGLAIVKKLIEAHQGTIGLESRLGEGSTFYVTLPTV